MAVSPSVLGKVLEIFERNFRERGELGASISIWWDGAELLSEGYGWCERDGIYQPIEIERIRVCCNSCDAGFELRKITG